MLLMPALRLALLATALLTGSLASAQTTYQWVDSKTGTTVISDHPPPPGTKQVVKRAGEESSEQQVPYATRQAAEKFPVTLYTSASCIDVCTQARGLLNARGVPFSEKILQNPEELSELTKLLGTEAGIPSIIVGRQNFKGFEPGAWNNLLDLAGYPKSAGYGSKPSGAFAK